MLEHPGTKRLSRLIAALVFVAFIALGAYRLWFARRQHAEPNHSPLPTSPSPEAPKSLLVGGLLLFNDGRIYGFPTAGKVERLEPGHSQIFTLNARAEPPLFSHDHILVFDTQEREPVNWSALTDQIVRTRLKTAVEQGSRLLSKSGGLGGTPAPPLIPERLCLPLSICDRSVPTF